VTKLLVRRLLDLPDRLLRLWPVWHVCSLVQANAKYWQVDTGSNTWIQLLFWQ